MWKIDLKVNTYTKTNTIIYEFTCRTYLWNYSLKLWRREKGKENDRATTISKYIISVQVEDIMICI
jgi:hypothetical protein